MIRPWQRREVFVSVRENAFVRAREALASAGIGYRYKVVAGTGG